MKRLQPTIDEMLQTQIQVIATTIRPGTVRNYHASTRSFLAYLHATFPRLHQLSQLRRNPHVLGWLRFLAQHHPPLRNKTRTEYLIIVRRLLCNLGDDYPLPPDLIRPEDFPFPDHYLPRPLSPDDDQRVQQQLCRSDTLEAYALRLIRATGLRIGECLDLSRDCLQLVGEQKAALHVPLGKLHSERWVPVDKETQHIVGRMLELGALASDPSGPVSQAFLLPRYCARRSWEQGLRRTLHQAARLAGCASRVVPHRLRHTFATEMVRLGVSMPALMQLLGHKDIRMTLRYVEVAQLDVQREFHRARQNTASLHSIPQLPLPLTPVPVRADLAAVRQAISATRHLFQLFLPQLEPSAQPKLHRLTQRLLNIEHELDHLTPK
jgi:site-specific recombinase XerD